MTDHIAELLARLKRRAPEPERPPYRGPEPHVSSPGCCPDEPADPRTHLDGLVELLMMAAPDLRHEDAVTCARLGVLGVNRRPDLQ